MAVIGNIKKKRKTNNTDETVDRLSFLPDVILVQILSLLSLKEAVATATLSRQWQNLWKQITSIRIDIYNTRDPFKQWTTFNKKIVTQLTSRVIRKFALNLHCGDLGDYRLSRINSWIRAISDRCDVYEIQATSNGEEGKFYFASIFKVTSLVILEITGGFAWNLPPIKFRDRMVSLPNLKKLTIQISLKQYEFVKHLIESCSKLEFLSLDIDREVRRCSGLALPPSDEELQFSSLSLKRLILRFNCEYPTNDIDVDAPNLTFLKLDSAKYKWTFRYTNEDKSGLTEVDLSGAQSGGFITNLAKAILNVRVLNLWRPHQIIDDVTVFACLIRLTCTVPCSDMDFRNLLSLLEKCHALEVLTLNLVTIRARKMSSLMLLAYCCIPMLTLERVKRFEINFESLELLDQPTLNFIKYVVSVVHVGLEQLILKVSGDTSDIEGWRDMEAYRNFLEWVTWYTQSRCKVEFNLGTCFDMMNPVQLGE